MEGDPAAAEGPPPSGVLPTGTITVNDLYQRLLVTAMESRSLSLQDKIDLNALVYKLQYSSGVIPHPRSTCAEALGHASKSRLLTEHEYSRFSVIVITLLQDSEVPPTHPPEDVFPFRNQFPEWPPHSHRNELSMLRNNGLPSLSSEYSPPRRGRAPPDHIPAFMKTSSILEGNLHADSAREDLSDAALTIGDDDIPTAKGLSDVLSVADNDDTIADTASDDESVVIFTKRHHSPANEHSVDATGEDLAVASPVDQGEHFSDATGEQFPVQPRRSQRPESDPAGICFPNSDTGIGDWIFTDSDIQVRLRKANPGNHIGYFALSLGFPRSNDKAYGTFYRGSRPSDLSPSDKYHISVRFPAKSIVKVDRLSDAKFESMKSSLRLTDTNDYWFVSVTYPEGKDATVVRTMLPYVGHTEEMTRWFTEDQPVERTLRLSHLLSKREWKFLMRFPNDEKAIQYMAIDSIDTTPFDFGYGKE